MYCYELRGAKWSIQSQIVHMLRCMLSIIILTYFKWSCGSWALTISFLINIWTYFKAYRYLTEFCCIAFIENFYYLLFKFVIWQIRALGHWIFLDYKVLILFTLHLRVSNVYSIDFLISYISEYGIVIIKLKLHFSVPLAVSRLSPDFPTCKCVLKADQNSNLFHLICYRWYLLARYLFIINHIWNWGVFKFALYNENSLVNHRRVVTWHLNVKNGFPIFLWFFLWQ
jgi:hypothetical protein